MNKDELIAKLAEHGIEANKSATKAELEQKLADVTTQTTPEEPATDTVDTEDPRVEKAAQALHKVANPNGKPWTHLQSAVKDRYREYTTAVLNAID